MKTKLLTDAGELTKHIAKLATQSRSLEAGIQLALASATFHAIAHGNINPLNELFTSLGKGTRRSAIQAWALEFMPVVLQSDKDKAKEAPFAFHRERVALLLDTTDKPTAEMAEAHAQHAAETPWVDFKPEQLIPAEFDVMELLQATIKRAKGLQSKGSTPKHPELLGKLEALLPAPVQGL